MANFEQMIGIWISDEVSSVDNNVLQLKLWVHVHHVSR